MKSEVSKPVMIGMICAALLLAVGVGFFLLRDKQPTTEINTKGREQLGPPPAKVAVPDWVKNKLAGAPAASSSN
jgi:hypothetical protein